MDKKTIMVSFKLKISKNIKINNKVKKSLINKIKGRVIPKVMLSAVLIIFIICEVFFLR